MDWKESEIDVKQCFAFFALQAISKEKAYDYISSSNQDKNFQIIPVVEKEEEVITKDTNSKTKKSKDHK